MPMFASTLGALRSTGLRTRSPHEFVKTRSGGSGRRPTTCRATAAGPDPLEPIRQLARAGSLDEVRQLWEAIPLDELRRASKADKLGREAMRVAVEVDESPALASKEGRQFKGRVLALLASVAAGDARAISKKPDEVQDDEEFEPVED